MATIGDLVTKLASVTGAHEPTVALIARNLREAGLIASGGRGRSAAKMNAKDCATMLIGLLASKQANESVISVIAYHNCEYVEMTDVSLVNVFDDFDKLIPDYSDSFIDQCSMIIEAAKSGIFQSAVSRLNYFSFGIQCQKFGKSDNECWGNISVSAFFEGTKSRCKFVKQHRHRSLSLIKGFDEEEGDMIETSRVSEKTVIELGNLISN